MNDYSTLLTPIANALGVSVTSLIALLFAINQIAKVIGRYIPNNATGFLAVVGRICSIIGADPSSRLAPGVSVQDVTAPLATSNPPVVIPPQK